MREYMTAYGNSAHIFCCSCDTAYHGSSDKRTDGNRQKVACQSTYRVACARRAVKKCHILIERAYRPRCHFSHVNLQCLTWIFAVTGSLLSSSPCSSYCCKSVLYVKWGLILLADVLWTSSSTRYTKEEKDTREIESPAAFYELRLLKCLG